MCPVLIDSASVAGDIRTLVEAWRPRCLQILRPALSE
jgi:hypothetical protein